MSRLPLVLVLVLAGCLETVRFGEAPLAGLVALSITPAQTTVTITDLEHPPTVVTYTALGSFDDGTTRDITAHVGWGVDNRYPGGFVGDGRYETSQAAGGHVVVRAVAGDTEGTAELRVIVRLTIIDGVFPPPLGAEALFAPDTPIIAGPSPRSPALLYPAHATRFPQGLARLLFQLATGLDNDAFRLRFSSDVLDLTVLTGADRWQPDAAIWTLIASSHPDREAQLVIDAASTIQPGAIHTSAPAALSFARASPGGILYYWSAGTSGIMRAAPSATFATPFYPAAPATTCASCHSVSRDGSKMVLGYDGEKLQIVALGDLTTVPNAAAGRPMGWAAFSPAGDLVVVAEKGTLTLRDAVSGLPVGPDQGRVPLPAKATHPDWSPDGQHLAVALSGDVANREVKAASIARLSYVEGVWGAVEILVPAAGDNNYFPRWSPDGRFLAYVRATGSSRGAASAELRLIPAGGGTPIPLRLANGRVGDADDVADLANTMPAWWPGGGDRGWLAFASARPYGAIRPLVGAPQIWIAAIDLALAEEGVDPSYPAFWLPSQDIRVRAHNPVWAVEPTRTE
jgi:hypothetical protein